jgi:hypothetical protein
MFGMALVCCSGKLIVVLALAIGQKCSAMSRIRRIFFLAAEGIIQCRELE